MAQMLKTHDQNIQPTINYSKWTIQPTAQRTNMIQTLPIRTVNKIRMRSTINRLIQANNNTITMINMLPSQIIIRGMINTATTRGISRIIRITTKPDMASMMGSSRLMMASMGPTTPLASTMPAMERPMIRRLGRLEGRQLLMGRMRRSQITLRVSPANPGRRSTKIIAETTASQQTSKSKMNNLE